MSDLSKSAQELLRTGRQGIEPGPGAAARVREKLAQTIASSDGGAGGEGGAGGAAHGAGAGLGAKGVVLAVVGVSAGLAIAYWAASGPGGEGTATRDPTAIARATGRDAGAGGAAAPAPQAPEPELVPRALDAGSEGEERPRQRISRAPAGAPPDAAPGGSRASATDAPAREAADPLGGSLMDELRFIEGARSLLARGQPDRALEVIGRHGDEFPAGQLGQEAAELRVRALCAAGRHAEAETAAARLAEIWPDSPFATRPGPICDL